MNGCEAVMEINRIDYKPRPLIIACSAFCD